MNLLAHKGFLGGAACLLLALSATPQPAVKSKKISPDLFGLFFEDINYSADGGLYAEMVQNRSFEYNPTERGDWTPYSFWEYTTPGFSYGTISVETSSPIHVDNPHYMVLNIEHVGKEQKHVGDAGVGLKNRGFEGMVVRQGDQYNFSFFARQLSGAPISLKVSLQSRKGRILAEQKLSTSSDDWKKYTGVLTATESLDTANLVILCTTEGKLAVDVVSLFPEKTFKNRPNGLRADLAQVLADIKPQFIRFPGGCLAHGDGLGGMYRWKKTIGPIEERKEQRNIWGYHQTAGLGYYEYFQFCEDIGAKPLPIVPAGVSCQNSGGTWRIGGTGQRAIPISEMPEYIQEVLDLIEWANGPATSTWGSKRAAAGHPKPFNLKYVGVGNEDKITPEFEERFKMIYDAVTARHPEIVIVGTVGPAPAGDDFTKGWTLADKLKLPMVDEHYYQAPEWLLSNLDRYDTYDRKASLVYLGEYASWGNKMANAIAEAAYMVGLERNGDVVSMASYAPLLAKKGFTQWNPDLIYFDNVHIYPTVNYYVQKLFSVNRGDTYYEGVISTHEKDSTLAASCVTDSETGDVILKLVNASTATKKMKVNLASFKGLAPKAELTVFTGKPDYANYAPNTQTLLPVSSDYKISKAFEYEVPATSLTVIRIKKKK
jgi:alpha-N-arabinofuranosidase